MATEQTGSELRVETLIETLNLKRWEKIRELLENGVKASACGGDAQHFLLTLALGRSMPWQLFIDFFDQPTIQDFIPFQMIATRYTEVERIRILSHIASRPAILGLLDREDLLVSTAFRLPDVQDLLRIVLYQERLYLLWLRPKVAWLSRVPTGVLRSLTLDYVT